MSSVRRDDYAEIFWNIVNRVKMKSEDLLARSVELNARHEFSTDQVVFYVVRVGHVFTRDSIEAKISTQLFFRYPVDKLVEMVVTELISSMQKDSKIEIEKKQFIDGILANPLEWSAFYIFADWLDDQGLELEAEQWRWRGQFFGAWGSGIIEREAFDEALTKSVDEQDYFVSVWRGYEFGVDRDWCQQHNLRYVPKWPESMDDVVKGRER